MNLKGYVFLLLLNILCSVTVNASCQNEERQDVSLAQMLQENEEPGDSHKDWGREHFSLGIGFGELVLPKLSIENYTFYFNSDCNGCDVEFLQDGVVVLEDVFDATGTYDIPEFLTGTLEVRLIIGNTIYVGTIEL